MLEEDEYQRRKDYYMSVGQRHYYFMNIGNGEVIDACRKVRQAGLRGGASGQELVLHGCRGGTST